MTSVVITTAGLERLRSRITRAANFLGSAGMERLMKEEGEALAARFKSKILSQTPGNVPDLTEAYKEQKQRKHGLIYPILYASGKMWRGIEILVTKPKAGSGWRLSLNVKGNTEAGTPYNVVADAHIKGEGNLPVRDFTKLPVGWSNQLVNKVRQGLRNARNNE